MRELVGLLALSVSLSSAMFLSKLPTLMSDDCGCASQLSLMLRAGLIEPLAKAVIGAVNLELQHTLRPSSPSRSTSPSSPESGGASFHASSSQTRLSDVGETLPFLGQLLHLIRDIIYEIVAVGDLHSQFVEDGGLAIVAHMMRSRDISLAKSMLDCALALSRKEEFTDPLLKSRVSHPLPCFSACYSVNVLAFLVI